MNESDSQLIELLRDTCVVSSRFIDTQAVHGYWDLNSWEFEVTWTGTAWLVSAYPNSTTRAALNAWKGRVAEVPEFVRVSEYIQELRLRWFLTFFTGGGCDYFPLIANRKLLDEICHMVMLWHKHQREDLDNIVQEYEAYIKRDTTPCRQIAPLYNLPMCDLGEIAENLKLRPISQDELFWLSRIAKNTGLFPDPHLLPRSQWIEMVVDTTIPMPWNGRDVGSGRFQDFDDVCTLLRIHSQYLQGVDYNVVLSWLATRMKSPPFLQAICRWKPVRYDSRMIHDSKVLKASLSPMWRHFTSMRDKYSVAFYRFNRACLEIIEGDHANAVVDCCIAFESLFGDGNEAERMVEFLKDEFANLLQDDPEIPRRQAQFILSIIDERNRIVHRWKRQNALPVEAKGTQILAISYLRRCLRHLLNGQEPPSPGRKEGRGGR